MATGAVEQPVAVALTDLCNAVAVVDLFALFRFDGLHPGQAATVAVEHPDFQSTLTATFSLGDEDLEGITQQIVSRRIGEFLAALLAADADDPARCQMVTTVTAMGPNQSSVYAPGEPGATVTIAPEVPPALGPVYFNTQVLPERALSETTTDGGVIVAGAEPGVYRWRVHKEGVSFTELSLTCVGGWLTNASPPYGLQVVP